MKDFLLWLKVAVAGIATFVSAKLGILAPLLAVLLVAMMMDYISGMIASSQEGELNSKRGIKGILKKLGYVFAVAVALICDKLIVVIVAQYGADIKLTAIFGMLTTIWLTLNEMLSITENLARIGVPLPKFLTRAISIMKSTVESKGE